MAYQHAETAALLDGHEAARRFFSSCFLSEMGSSERLWVAHVDDATRCLHLEFYEGKSIGIPVREIIQDAARFGSAGLVLARNHPCGDARPSNAERLATQKLARAAETLDLKILDYLIFAGDDCSSMRRMGLL